MNVTQIEVWNGKNFNEILSKISEVNTETRIKVLGKRIIINDPSVGYYQNVVIGDTVEVPVYEGCIDCDEDEDEDMAIAPPMEYNHELSNQMMLEWGLPI